MKRTVTYGLLVLILLYKLKGQDLNYNYDNYPIVISLQFHSFSMPFQKISHHFRNVGIGIGTEVGFKENDQKWAQSVKLVWYRNKTMGNGVQLYTQSVYRPDFSSNVFGEVKLGIGYQYMYRPVESFKYEAGGWKSAGKKGKHMMMLPFNVGFGFVADSNNEVLQSINYQWMILKGYNESIPIVPNATIILDTRIH